VCVVSDDCMSTAASPSAVAANITSDVFGLGRPLLFINEIETEECQMIENDYGVFSFKISLGACGMTTTQFFDEDGTRYIQFGVTVSSNSKDSIGDTINFGNSVIKVAFTFDYLAEVDVETSLVLREQNTTTTEVEVGSWAGTFRIEMYDNQFKVQQTTDDLETTVGAMVYLGIHWDVTELSGEAKFMINKCTITQDGQAMEVDLIRRNCYLSTLSASNMNEGKAVLVDQTSYFKYQTFLLTESVEDDMKLNCEVSICLIDSGGNSIDTADCALTASNADCALETDFTGFVYVLDEATST